MVIMDIKDEHKINHIEYYSLHNNSSDVYVYSLKHLTIDIMYSLLEIH